MKIEPANETNQATLLALMHEAYLQEPDPAETDWATIKAATGELLRDPNAGEVYLIYNDKHCAVGYMIMYRRFSVQSGGYFSRIDDVYMRGSEPGRFRDEGLVL